MQHQIQGIYECLSFGVTQFYSRRNVAPVSRGRGPLRACAFTPGPHCPPRRLCLPQSPELPVSHPPCPAFPGPCAHHVSPLCSDSSLPQHGLYSCVVMVRVLYDCYDSPFSVKRNPKFSFYCSGYFRYFK